MTSFERLDDNRLLLPVDYKKEMNVSGIIYASVELEGLVETRAIDQVAAVASLPGIVGYSLAMPDIHAGYGFPIGGVAAFDINNGIISPGGVGYDINCGVRLIRSSITKDEIMPVMKEAVIGLYHAVPSGLGTKGNIRLNQRELLQVFSRGAGWAVESGYGNVQDLLRIESNGCLSDVYTETISEKAIERGLNQLGTLGSGNHFLEIQYVDKVYDEVIAASFGLFKRQVTLMIHSGSRGLGHQVCTDYISIMEHASRKYGINLVDKELSCAPFNSPEGGDYFSAMKASANYAWANRQCIGSNASEALMKALGMSPKSAGFELLYDVAHNIAKIERHIFNGKKLDLIVHRKGATRAFPPGHNELTAEFKVTGQPVLIPGDMGRASYVMSGLEGSMNNTFGSTCHGAGRVMSRHQALKAAKGRSIFREMEDLGIMLIASDKRSIGEEMSEAYKDVSKVIDVVEASGLCKKVARLRPIGVVKG
ncbi:MAG: RtcB family protein [Nitrospirae bacterium]|nr:RtcB family protein [Nitrospirota bacterium]